MPTGSTTRIETTWAAAVRRLGYIKRDCLCFYNNIVDDPFIELYMSPKVVNPTLFIL
jgi:hypothetical protein